MNIKTPPAVVVNPFAALTQNYPNQLEDYLEFYSPVDKKGRYLPYDELRHRIASGLDHQLVWSLTRLARTKQQTTLIELGEPAISCGYLSTPLIQQAISAVDRNTTTASLEWISSKIDEKSQFEYLLNNLIEDESISSSQLEGAATTTQVAKELIKRNRKPRSEDERMIVGNYKMMLHAWEMRDQPLSLDLITELHKIGVEGIDDDAYAPGYFRQSNTVHVVNAQGAIVHTPPSCENLVSRLQHIVDWANFNHDAVESTVYVHPLIKAIVLHFCMGYEHPFKDGNGRVARALFYWFMFKNDFSTFRYIAISVLLKKAPVQYGKSYLYTETDKMDLTYFIEYQAGIIIRAIEKFKDAYKSTAVDIDQFNLWLVESGLHIKLTDNQKAVLQAAKVGTATEFTVRNVEKLLNCSYNTAAVVLNDLVDFQLFTKAKKGREWVYSLENTLSVINKA
ncbi:MAG: Fic family protein [Gammaproteobacteria bacterium]|nr:Fic family protein [Gammaproteobacteria bacterium]